MLQTLGEQSDIFQTTSKRRKFGPNHMLIYCNYPNIYIYIYICIGIIQIGIYIVVKFYFG